MHTVSNRVAGIVAALLLIAASTAAAQSPLEQARQLVAEGNLTEAARAYDQAVKSAPQDRDVLVEAGDVNMELERYNIARQLYERAVDAERKDAEANRKLGLALSALGDHGAAIKAVSQAIKYDDDDMASYLALSDVYIAIGKDSLQRAELTAMTARKKFPEAAEPYLSLGDNYFARGIYELAMSQYEEALKRNPTLVEPRVRLGRSYREMARRTSDRTQANEYYNKALQEFNRVTTVNAKIARPWYEQGEIYLLAERWKEAGTSFENYVKLRPEDPRGDLMLSRAAYGGSYYSLAVPPLERILSKNDSLSLIYHPQARAMLAKSYYAIKDYPKAVETYRMLPDSVFDVETTQFFGSALMQVGDTNQALNVYSTLLQKNPNDCDLSLKLGNMLYKNKRYEQVIDVFTRRAASCPDAPSATPNLYVGLSNYSLKRFDSAIAAFNRSIAADSSVFLPYYWLVNAHAAKKDFASAAAVARMVDRRGFESDEKVSKEQLAVGYFFMGLEAFQAKKFKESNEYMLRAVKLNPAYSDAYLYLGFGYHSLTDTENACKYYKLTLKHNPANKDAQKNLKALGCG
jgi:O-antigen biosynthesis protein